MTHRPTDQEVQKEMERILKDQLKRQVEASRIIVEMAKMLPPLEHKGARGAPAKPARVTTSV